MTPEFDKLYEGLWDNINKAKKRGKTSSKWKNDPKYRKQMKKQAAKISKMTGKSIKDIMQKNRITNPNKISVGQRLSI